MTAARLLFTAVGAFWLLIGMLTALLSDRSIGPPIVFLSERTDTALYGGHPDEVLHAIPELRILRHTTVKGTLAGFLVAAGGLTAAVGWFGLEEPQTWALGVLTAVGLMVLPFWWVALAPYRHAEISLSLGDIPPFMWIPAILMPLAGVIGWIAHFRG